MSSGEHDSGAVNCVTSLVEAPLEPDFWKVRCHRDAADQPSCRKTWTPAIPALRA